LKLDVAVTEEALVDAGVFLEDAENFQLFRFRSVDPNSGFVLGRLAVLEPDHG
jgi:hypothetical protein